MDETCLAREREREGERERNGQTSVCSCLWERQKGMDGKVRRKNERMERAGREGCRCGNENGRIRRRVRETHMQWWRFPEDLTYFSDECIEKTNLRHWCSATQNAPDWTIHGLPRAIFSLFFFLEISQPCVHAAQACCLLIIVKSSHF